MCFKEKKRMGIDLLCQKSLSMNGNDQKKLGTPKFCPWKREKSPHKKRHFKRKIEGEKKEESSFYGQITKPEIRI